MSMNTITRNWVDNFHGLRKDERGAESSEVILVLVLLVIGLLAAWAYLKDAIFNKATDTADCIEGANDAATQDSCS